MVGMYRVSTPIVNSKNMNDVFPQPSDIKLESPALTQHQVHLDPQLECQKRRAPSPDLAQLQRSRSINQLQAQDGA
jgi:hypothetical protein